MVAQETAVVKAAPAETAVAVHSDKLGDLQRLGNLLAASGYFADAQEMAQAAVKVMAGDELGVPPIASMMGINVIKGKIAMGGNLIATRIRAHGYDYKITRHDNEGCEITFYGKKNGGNREELGKSSFTAVDAKAAGVFGHMYEKYPRNMYFNRAISNGAKWHTPEVFAGMPVYTPEELGAVVDEDGNVDHGESKKPKRRKKERIYETGETKDELVARRLEEIKKDPPPQAPRLEEPPPPEDPAPPPERVQDDEKPPAPKRPFDFKEMIGEFGKIKMEFLAFGAMGQKWYYDGLAAHGVKHANELKTAGAARKCFAGLKTSLAALKKGAGAELAVGGDTLAVR